MLNNPVNFNDPTGHKTCNEEGYCFENGVKTRNRAFDPLDRKTGKKKSDGDLSKIIGLDTSSEEACTINSCVTNLPANTCPLGQTCLSSWSTPAHWDLSPNSSDYFGLNISYGRIYIFSPTVQISVDRYGQMYLSGGLSAGTEAIAPYPSFSTVFGTIGGSHNKFIPDPIGTESFLTGPSINISGGAVGGHGLTISPATLDHVSGMDFIRKNALVAPYSIETGLYSPQIGISGSFGIKLPIICTWCNGEN